MRCGPLKEVKSQDANSTLKIAVDIIPVAHRRRHDRRWPCTLNSLYNVSPYAPWAPSVLVATLLGQTAEDWVKLHARSSRKFPVRSALAPVAEAAEDWVKPHAKPKRQVPVRSALNALVRSALHAPVRSAVNAPVAEPAA